MYKISLMFNEWQKNGRNISVRCYEPQKLMYINCVYSNTIDIL